MKWFKRLARTRRLSAPGFHPLLEALEDRCLLTGTVLQTNLVSDLPGVAQNQDPQLVNPWGISESSSSPFWISDNGAGTSTLYNAQGQPQPPGNNPPLNPLQVTIPTVPGSTASHGTPTGTVFNTDSGGGGFKVTNGTKSAPAIFLFDTEDGTIVGWNPGVNPAGSDPTKAGTFAIIAVDNSGNNFTQPDPLKQTGAVYKGLTIASATTPIFPSDPASTTVIYASNFRSGQVEAYDTNFQRVTSAGAFADSRLPQGYAPFDVQVLNGKVYVTYAKQDAAKHDDVAGPGNGFVDVFNLDGSPGLANGQKRLISRGDLNSPWGLAIAPSTTSATSNFGAQGANLAGALLVGNFGDGRIHAYDATTGAELSTLTDPDGEPIQIPGLWALKVGNGGQGGDSSTIYFTAGLDHENHGLFGSLSGVAPGADGSIGENTEQQMVEAEIDAASLHAMTLINDINTNVPKATLHQDVQALDSALEDLASAESRFFRDTHTVFQGTNAQGGATLQSLGTLLKQLTALLD
jgi:uncharacterized protein (TIGR03118 family)